MPIEKSVSVLPDSRAMKLIEAIHCAFNAYSAVRQLDLPAESELSQKAYQVAVELAWDLVNEVGHEDISGQEVQYGCGDIGVSLAVTQCVHNRRKVERKIAFGVIKR